MHAQFKVTQHLCFIIEDSKQIEFFEVPETSRFSVCRTKTDGKNVGQQLEFSM